MNITVWDLGILFLAFLAAKGFVLMIRGENVFSRRRRY